MRKILLFLGGYILFFIPMSFADDRNLDVDYIPTIDKEKIQGMDKYETGDLFSGAGTFHIPLEFPKGPRNLEVDLGLGYNSYSLQPFHPYGYGWNINTSMVYRNMEDKTSDIYTQDSFIVDGQEFLPTSTVNVYESKDTFDQRKLTYMPITDSWELQDEKGNTYYYGTSADAKLQNPDDITEIYSWHLEKKQDSRGHEILYTYFKHEHQVYLDTVNYAGALYEIDFVYIDKTASLNSYQTYFEVKTTKLLSEIQFSESSNYVKSYKLEYDSTVNTRSFLESVSEESGADTKIRYDFTYNDTKDIHLLEGISMSTGLDIDFTYKQSTQYETSTGARANPNLPFPVNTLHEVTYTDTITNVTNTDSYYYGDGAYYYDATDVFGREYAGFGTVEKSNSYGGKEIYYFHQGANSLDRPSIGEHEDHISKKGKMFRKEIYDGTNIYKSEMYKWNHTLIGDRWNVSLIRQTQTLDGTYTSASTYIYDASGNMIEKNDFGRVTLNNEKGEFTDIGTDSRKQTYVYTSNSGQNLWGYQTSESLYNHWNTLTAKKEFTYDGGILNLGELTEEKVYIDSTQYVDTDYTYNAQGLLTTEADPEGNMTTYVYDVHNLYPLTISNDKGHTETLIYDYGHGVPLTHTDANGYKKIYEYDNFGRLETEKIDIGTVYTLKDIAYDDISLPNSIIQSVYRDTTPSNDEQKIYIYLDGLGNTLQTRTELSGQYSVQTNSFDGLGRKTFSSYPQFLPTSGYQANTSISNLYGDTYVYDDTGRIEKITNVDGDIVYNYNANTFTLTDRNNNTTEYSYNAFGNLTQVKESGNILTQYSYNSRNNLTRITDADGNIRHFTYDFASRQMTAEDLHNPSDTEFGVKGYVYDNNSNIIEEHTQSGEKILNSYDELDRLTQSTTHVTSHVRYEFTTPSNAHYFNISPIIYGHSGDKTLQIKAWIDNLSIRTASGELLPVVNGAFSGTGEQLGHGSSWLGGTSANGWKGQVSQNGRVALEDGKLSMELTGNNSYIQVRSTSHSYWNVTAETLPIEPNTTYIVEYDYATEYVSGDSDHGLGLNLMLQEANNIPAGEIRTLPRTKTTQEIETTNYYYDEGTYELGRLSRIQKGDYAESYDYDIQGNLISETKTFDTDNYTYVYDYNIGQEITSLTYPDGTEVEYDRNKGVIEEVSYEGQTVLDTLSYNPLGQLSDGTMGNNAILEKSYDEQRGLRIAAQKLIHTGNNLSHQTYSYDNVGNMLSLHEQGTTTTLQRLINYSYDNLNRLTQANYDSGAEVYNYTYNDIGNILTANGDSYTYQDDGFNNPQAVTKVGNIDYGYDKAGNVTSRIDGPNEEYLVYNPKNEMTWYIDENWNTTFYTYDTNGIRVQKKDETGENRYMNKDYEVYIGDPKNVLMNPSFEGEGVRSGGSYQWIDEETKGWAAMTIRAASAELTDGRLLLESTGDGYVQARNTKGSYHNVTPDSISVQPNTTYVLEYDYETEYITGDSNNGFSVKILTQASNNVSTGEFTTMPYVEATTPITRVKYQFTTPATANYLNISPVLYAHTGDKTLEMKAWVDNISLREVISGDVTEVSKHIFFGDMKVASIDDGETIYHYDDHLGGGNIDLDDSGSILQKTDYLPFGEVRTKINTSLHDNKYLFTGKEQDSESSLQYFEARYYDNRIGRFAGQDRVFWEPGRTERGYMVLNTPQQLNSYSYVGNNPLVYNDPTGEFYDSVVDVVVGGGAYVTGKITGDDILVTAGKNMFKDSINPVNVVNPAKKIEKAKKIVNLGKKITKNGIYRPDRSLPKDQNGKQIPDSNKAHTQLGNKNGRTGNYTQGREWGENGDIKKDIDFTDHNRPQDHSNPHQHKWTKTPTGGAGANKKREGAEPLTH